LAEHPVAELLARRLIVCVGTGGVGKTTTAAALALAGARRGRRCAVITVDPSRRLKDALGVAALAGEPEPVAVPGAAGTLEALALDTKRTFDRLIARVAPPDTAARIFANRLYQEISSELGGSTEYMAMEKLHELLASGRYDLVVVDTPPSADVRELLSAPGRMAELLASQAVDFLKAPAAMLAGGPESGLARATLAAVLKALERWTGMTLLSELSDFVAGFEHLVDGFRSRAHAIEAALRGPDAAFVIVTTAEPGPVAASLAFDRELARAGYRVSGYLANRIYAFPPLAADAGAGAPAALRRKLRANYADFAALGDRDRAALAHLAAVASAPVLATVPVQEQAPVSLDALGRIASLLDRAEAPAAPRRGRAGRPPG
jgi:anion-transporting  ArsA/GET3 family ATPase